VISLTTSDNSVYCRYRTGRYGNLPWSPQYHDGIGSSDPGLVFMVLSHKPALSVVLFTRRKAYTSIYKPRGQISQVYAAYFHAPVEVRCRRSLTGPTLWASLYPQVVLVFITGAKLYQQRWLFGKVPVDFTGEGILGNFWHATPSLSPLCLREPHAR
jgi:hypothetical protein